MNQQINLKKYFFAIDFIPAQRHSGIDAILKEYYDNVPIFIKIQREYESIDGAYRKLQQAVKKKSQKSFLVQTHCKSESFVKIPFDNPKIYIAQNATAIVEIMQKFSCNSIVAN